MMSILSQATAARQVRRRWVSGAGISCSDPIGYRDQVQKQFLCLNRGAFRQGDTFCVVIRFDDNLVEHLRVIKDGDALRIGLKPNLPAILRATLQAEGAMPELAALDLSGATLPSMA